ncbi:MAG: exodeoxyribonuclease VII large subunit [Saprospiraceae bacterium]
MQSISLLELNEFIRRVIALNFSEPLWVRAEISQINQSRGHFYLNLVEKGENQDILAKTDAVIWNMQYRQMKRKLGENLDDLLRDGVEVLIRASVDFHERYGLKLVIDDIDPAFTLGKLALKRQETIKMLQKEGLMERNKLLESPLVVQRIAILSSETAAGYIDFVQQLQSNNFGYQFQTVLFPIAVQGMKVEEELSSAFDSLKNRKGDFDAVVVIRGGGSRLDLMGFDSYLVGKSIANSPIPVFTGIGHEVDESVADLVAHKALKTPTAVAEYIIQKNLSFETQILTYGQEIQFFAQNAIQHQKVKLSNISQQIQSESRAQLKVRQLHLDNFHSNLHRSAQSILNRQVQEVNSLEKQIALLEPKQILDRGFSITVDENGMVVKSEKDVQKGSEITTILKEGKLVSMC